MRAAALLLCLIILSPVAQAADWLIWRKVGDATLTWGPFTVYTSQLRTPEGRYSGENGDRALIITYAREIDRDDLVEATRDQWQAQGILEQEPQSEAWRSGPMLGRAASWRLWSPTGRGSSGTALRRRRKTLFHWDHVSPPRSARAFWQSGSVPARNIPRCVSS